MKDEDGKVFPKIFSQAIVLRSTDTRQFTSGSVVPFMQIDYDTTGGKVIPYANGIIDVKHKGQVLIMANLWCYCSKTDGRPWVNLRNYSTGFRYWESINDSTSNYAGFSMPPLLLELEGDNLGITRFVVGAGTNNDATFNFRTGNSGRPSYITIILL